MKMVRKASTSVDGGVGSTAIVISNISGNKKTPMKPFIMKKIWRIIPARTNVLTVSSSDNGFVPSLGYSFPPNFVI